MQPDINDYIAGEWVGPNTQQKVTAICPECGTKNEVLWFPARQMSYRKKGTTGGSGFASTTRGEKVFGNCEKCDYRFKPDDLD